MGFFKKMLGTFAVAGAAVGGALYVKKRKDERYTNTGFEDFDDQKIFDWNHENDQDGNKKVTITFNSKKAKNVADKAADKVIDATDKMKDVVTDKLGEETVNSVKEKLDVAKDKLSDVADSAKDMAKDAKEIVIDKVGEENIQAAKDKVKDVAVSAKDKVSEKVNKIIKSSADSEKDFVNEDIETEDDVNVNDADILEDELEEI